MTHLVFLGRQADVAQAELEGVLARFHQSTQIEKLTSHVVGITLDDTCSAQKLIDVLGGTVKIAKMIKSIQTVETPAIEAEVIEVLRTVQPDKTRKTFSIAEHDRNHLDALSLPTIKKGLVKAGLTARFVETSREGGEAALILEGDIAEIHVVHIQHYTILGLTEAVQDVHNWSHRDMDKPYRDMRRGMLPPKLARSLVNLAVGAKKPSDLTILDPFCGTGTVLMEGMLLGAHVIGTDLAPDSVHGAGNNLAWMQKEYTLTDTYSLAVQDVTQISTVQTNNQKVDAIVTEPFLGKQNPDPADIDNMLKGLEKLYLGAFKQWLQILQPGGVVVIAFPFIQHKDRVKTVQTLIDRLESLGYTREKGPYLYTRPGAFVQRALYVYRLKE